MRIAILIHLCLFTLFPTPGVCQDYSSLLIKVQNQDYSLKITEIMPGSPMLSLSDPFNPDKKRAAMVGHKISIVNQQFVQTASELNDALAKLSAGDKINMTLQDSAGNWYFGNTKLPDSVEPPSPPAPDDSQKMPDDVNQDPADPKPVKPLVIDDPNNPVFDSKITNRKIWVLLAGDTNDSQIGSASRININGLRDLLGNESQIRKRWRRPIKVLTGGNCTKPGIESAIDKMDVKPDDTLLVYVSSHGAYSASLADDSNDGHFLNFGYAGFSNQEDLVRRDLFKLMTGKKARLTLLVTDSCNKAVPPPPSPGNQGDYIVGNPPPQRKKFTSIEKLLLFYRGEIDINACSKNEYAWSSPVNGSYFSNSICKNCKYGVTWENVIESTIAATNWKYQEVRKRNLSALNSRLYSNLSPTYQALKDDLDDQPKQTPHLYSDIGQVVRDQYPQD